MPTSNHPQPSLTQLLAELESAVRAGNRQRATQLEQLILQQLKADSDERDAVERRVRELMQRLDRPAAQPDIRFRSSSSGADGNVRSGSSPADSDDAIYPVWFGTNRKPTADGKGFTGERHNHLTRGRVNVHVPEAHRFGETGSSFWQKLKRWDWRDDQLRLRDITRLERDAFFAEVQQRLGERQAGEPGHALLFLHGYLTTFEDAAIRAAQIGVDLQAPATAFFSWPSRGQVAAYPADEASIEASERLITEFLTEFTTNCGAEKVHVIAHSMGNRGLLRALQRIAANAQTQGKVRFGQIFLAAPDVDRDLFLDLARLYKEHSDRTTLYASKADLPVHLSSKVHDAPRAGYFTPYTVAPGLLDTVAVPDFNIDLLGHSYFAQAEALLHDIFDLMRNNQNPAQRQRIAPDFDGTTSFWKIKR
ncbi:MAG: alpha/beta fold hydrolase [Acidobacteriota bacterium]|nr:alpha/beta fold hydrolase [Acidobacteriota bacterium]